MTGSIPSIPGLGSSNGTQRSSTRNPYLPVVTADTLNADNLGKDSFYSSSGDSQQAEPSWADRAVGFFRSIGETLRLIDPPSKQDNPTGDSFSTH